MKLDMTKHENREAVPVGRFSSNPQDLGDSRERQSKTFASVCRRLRLQPSERFAIFDAGKSASKGKHLRPDAEFGAFLEKMRAGKIKPDASGRMPVLVWEAVDRFTRMGGFLATDITREIVNAGLAMVFDDDDLWIDSETIDDVWAEFQAAVAAAMKYAKKLGKRMASSWEARRAAKVARHKCPSWVRWNGAGYVEIPEKAALLRKAIDMAIDGHGCEDIRQRLGMDKDFINLAGILRSRTLLGECQMKVGEAKKGYYPPAIADEKKFIKLQAEIDSRRTYKGKRGLYVTNLFRDLIYDAADGNKMTANRCTDGHAVLRSRVKRKMRKQINYDVVERALLTWLDEITVADLLPADLRAGNDEMEKLESHIAALNEEAQDLINAPIGSGGKLIAARLAKIEAARDEAYQQVEKLRRQRSTTDVDSLADAQTITGLLASAKGDELLSLRLRLRDCIRRLVSEIWILVRGVDCCEVQIFKHGSAVCQFIVESGEWIPYRTDGDMGFWIPHGVDMDLRTRHKAKTKAS